MQIFAGAAGRFRSLRPLLGTALVGAAFSLGACGGDSEKNESAAEPELAHWSYEGSDGPGEWASLDSEYGLCETGREQSPVDITGAAGGAFPPAKLSYSPESLTLINNGHAIEAELEDPESSVTIGGKEYGLAQFHVHSPAEEKIEGRSFAASIHLVHLTDKGEAAVIGLLAEPGPENPVIAKLIDQMPLEDEKTAEIEGDVDLTDLVPSGAEAFRYKGSLTTPPCTEGITWTVFRKPITMSQEQLEAFTDAHPGNARPVQPLNGREILSGPGTA